jgi:hypothetical protein
MICKFNIIQSDFMHYERRRRTTLSNINEGIYKTYKEGMIAFVPKTYPIQDDYEFSDTVLGKGFNGKVTVITNKKTGSKCALKVKLYLFVTLK